MSDLSSEVMEDKSKPFSCNYCSRRFMAKSGLASHLSAAHWAIRRKRTKPKRKSKNPVGLDMDLETASICSVCKAAFRCQYDLLNHMISHTARPHQCSACSRTFGTPSKLRAHVANVHEEPKKLFKCDLCPTPKHFTLRNSLELHVISAHVVDKEFHCKVCTKSFLTEKELLIHTWKIHQRKAQDREPIKVKPFRCDSCPTTFGSMGVLKTHIIRVHGYKCELCTTVFKSMEDYEEHLKLGKPLTCPDGFCLRKLVSKCTLQKHYSKCHVKLSIQSKSEIPEKVEYLPIPTPVSETRDIEVKEEGDASNCPGPKLYCVKCSQVPVFSTAQELKLHDDSAHPEILWPCEICSASFNSLDDLSDHREYEHPSSNLQCKYCPKSFCTGSQLNRHLENHARNQNQEYKCEYCPNRSFATGKSYRYHLSQVHRKKDAEAEKSSPPFVCEYCSKEFKLLRYLKKHTKLELEKVADKEIDSSIVERYLQKNL